MELNRENIIKALECCTKSSLCARCPRGDYDTCDIEADALSLINELTEENKAWQMQLIDKEEKADKAYHDLACEVEDLRAENERLRDTAYRLECEVHRERADTVRKMQERLDKHFCHDPAFLGVEQRLIMDVIDQIAKEMVEGTKC